MVKMKALTINDKTYEIVDGNAIQSPVKATVGQTIIVKSVDEFGKPTEWEAVDVVKVPDWAMSETKPAYTASEVGALPDTTVIPVVPTNISAFQNDIGYLTEHQSLDGFATETYVQTYAQPKGNYLTEHQDISGKLDANKLPEAINTALSQAKESGEFDGTDGYSPVRGTDYWTDADKAEIKSYVDEAILGGAW
jgi:hypothetical protein